jgi:hypothetical protein
MTKQEVIKLLKEYNCWRRGAECIQLNPDRIGKVIDEAVRILNEECTELNKALTLVDSAINIIELHNPIGDNQTKWKRMWLKSARELFKPKV